MLNLNGIPFSPEAITRINASVANYKRFARIDISTEPIGDTLKVIVEQYEPAPNGKVLSAGDLFDRGMEVFKDLMPDGFVYVITARPYEP